ncbi:hypothetical protein IIB51_02955 [Patescibacteria group bacterium]|nr:hypothetical protein [Patescibacteria group bacterium]MCH8889342.1 hypothetical protein [Patescibacteria group bacterium]
MSTAQTLVLKINSAIINPLIGLLLAMAFAWFVWGLVQFIWGAQSEEDRAKGKRSMIWGIFGMFVMIAVFGILALLMRTFGVTLPTP